MAKVGEDVLSYCTSCKLDLNHTVVAATDTSIIKVQCRTCKKEHRYSAPKGAKDGSVVFKAKEEKVQKETKVKAETKTVEREWQEMMSKTKDKAQKPFSIKTTYAAGELISHPTFGVGYVRKVLHPSKIEVLFSMDVKVLIHDKK